jgi:UDP-2,3-diacylglucosamine pyrophosphatase LpxH
MANYKSIFISDTHLGFKHSNSKALLHFLKNTEAENYFLIGDIIDGWALRSKWYWPQCHNDIIQFFLNQSKDNKNVIYVKGNHDDFLEDFLGASLGNILITDQYVYNSLNGKSYLLIHGDQFDTIVCNAKWLAYVGGWAYDWLISLNTMLHGIYKLCNAEGWSIAAWIKYNVKSAVKFISNYEDIVTDYARTKEVDGVICGHIHHANIMELENIEYMNTGDWVESCTAIVEDFEGNFQIIKDLK